MKKVKKYPKNFKKNFEFLGEMGKFQTQAQKSSKVDFVWS